MAPSGPSPRRLDQGHKETAVSGVFLRVPLDAYGEPGAEHLHRLDAAVAREPDGPKPATELVDSLVVMAKALGLGARIEATVLPGSNTTRLGLVCPSVARCASCPKTSGRC